MALETYECAYCEDEFAAHPDARAAETKYCSPECETEARDL